MIDARMKVMMAAAKDAAKTTGAKDRAPRPCCGGCGEWTRGGNWFPGHDGRVNGRTRQLIRAGLTLDEVVEVVHCGAAWDTEEVVKRALLDRDERGKEATA